MLPARAVPFYGWAMRVLAALLPLLFLGPATAAPISGGAILIYSGTTGYRHESIPAGVRAITALARRRGIRVVASEDPAIFSAGGVKPFKAIVFLNSTTDPKNPASEWLVGERRAALERFVAQGGGVMAVHAAADSHYHWPWYGRLIGGRFARHPDGTPAGKVTLMSRGHAAVRGLGTQITRTDEWYYFDDYDPTSTLLATLDAASIGEPDINPNPVAWTRQVGRARVFYTAMGHTKESYSEPWFLQHLAGGLDWVLRRR